MLATYPGASAVLDVVSSNKGVLLPRVAAVAAITSPTAGLLTLPAQVARLPGKGAQAQK